MQLAYDILQITGAAAAVVYFAVSLKLHKAGIRVIAVSGAMAAGCLFLAVLFVSALRNVIYTRPPGGGFIELYNQYYITAVFFAALYTVLAGIFGLFRQTMGAVAESLIIFSFISRIGCCVLGCCGSKDFGGVVWPLQYFELAFAAAVFTVMRLFKTGHKLGFYMFSYSIFRFGIEFLRENAGIRTYGGLNIRQYIAITVIAAGAAAYIALRLMRRKRRQNEKIA